MDFIFWKSTVDVLIRGRSSRMRSPSSQALIKWNWSISADSPVVSPRQAIMSCLWWEESVVYTMLLSELSHLAGSRIEAREDPTPRINFWVPEIGIWFLWNSSLNLPIGVVLSCLWLVLHCCDNWKLHPTTDRLFRPMFDNIFKGIANQNNSNITSIKQLTTLAMYNYISSCT